MMLLLPLLMTQCTALKIAITDNVGDGVGSGSGAETKTKTKIAFESTGITIPKVAGSSVKIGVAAAKEISSGAGAADVFSVSAVVPTDETISKSAVLKTATLGLKVKKSSAGITTDVTVTGLTTAFEFTLTKLTAVSMECVFFDTTLGDWSTDGVTTISQTTTVLDCSSTHMTSFGGRPVGGGVGGDPKATNLAGEKFEILAMGTFSLLSVRSAIASENKLTLDATIDRAGEMCGATYIKNASLTGSWIEEEGNVKEIKIAAASEVAKEKALEIALDGTWFNAKEIHDRSKMVVKASQKQVKFLVHGVTIQTTVDAHRIRKNGIKTTKFANFLNINVEGMKGMDKEGIKLGGLLAYDDHSFAAQTPDGCNSKSFHFKQISDSVDPEPESGAFFVSSTHIW